MAQFTEKRRGRFGVKVPMVCNYGHEWNSDVVQFQVLGNMVEKDRCPQCGRFGKQRPLTSESLDGIVDQETIDCIGQGPLGVFVYLVTEMMLDLEAPDFNSNRVVTIDAISKRLGVSKAYLPDWILILVANKLVTVHAPTPGFLRDGQALLFRPYLPWHVLFPKDVVIQTAHRERSRPPMSNQPKSLLNSVRRFLVCGLLGCCKLTTVRKELSYKQQIEGESAVTTVTVWMRGECSTCGKPLSPWEFVSQKVTTELNTEEGKDVGSVQPE